MSEKETNLTYSHRLTRNIIWNLFGTGTPILIALMTIPILVDGLGTARFGILTLAWMVVGYFSLFDMGLGRALIKFVAERLGTKQADEIPGFVWIAILLMVLLGGGGGGVLFFMSPWIVEEALNIPAELQAETLSAFYYLAVSLPFVIASIGFRGVLEAHQYFGIVNIIRVPLGALSFVTPLAILPFSQSLSHIVLALVYIRVISCFVYIVVCINTSPELRLRPQFDMHKARQLLRFGGWMTVTNVIGPLMVYMDRFLIGSVLTVSAVAYYATPYEMVTKLWIISGALMGVLFPAFSATVSNNPRQARILCKQALKFTFLLLLPIVLIIVTYANEGLNLWLGEEFSDNSAVVLQLLAVGVLVNSHAQIPFGIIQATGRADLTAKLHLLELPFYLLLLWWSLNNYGIAGAAFAWLLRVTFDMVFLFGVTYKKGLIELASAKEPSIIILLSSFILYAGAIISDAFVKGAFLIVTLAVFVLASWFFILSKDEKNWIRKYFYKPNLDNT